MRSYSEPDAATRHSAGDVRPNGRTHSTADSHETAITSPGRSSTDLSAESIAGYRLIKVLGHGGMGTVWEAEDEESHQRVALKVMHSEHVVDNHHRLLFQREAEALARLDHPSIAALFRSGHTEDGHDFFSMEMVRGPTLDRWIAGRALERDSAELEHRLRIFQSICDAVQYAHQRGVVHRDLKPSNLIIRDAKTADGEGGSNDGPPGIMILDFGLAGLTDSDIEATTIPEIGVIRGTLQYMSPEQARCDGEAIGVQSDVYSLGVILYELLTGAHPYEVSHSALAEALHLICEEPPIPLKRNWAWSVALGQDLSTIVEKALEKETGRRYSTVAELGEDINRYLTGSPIRARRPGVIYRLRTAANRAFDHTVGSIVDVLIFFSRLMKPAGPEGSTAAQPRARARLGAGTIENILQLFGFNRSEPE